jgi:hypothetical protein
MLKVTVIKAFRGIEGFVRPGAEIEVDEARGKALAQNGLIAPLEGGVEVPAEPKTPGVITGNPKPKRRRGKLLGKI